MRSVRPSVRQLMGPLTVPMKRRRLGSKSRKERTRRRERGSEKKERERGKIVDTFKEGGDKGEKL